MEGVDRSGSLLEALDSWANETPDKIALTFLDDSGLAVGTPLTYGTLRSSVDALAAHILANLGLAKGSTCLLVYPPSLDFTVAFLACLRAGVIAVPCFPPDPKRLKKDLNMFAAIQGSSGATVALTNKMYNYAKKMSDIKSMFAGGAAWPELQWVVTDSLLVPESDSTESFSVPDPADIAFLQYTSGSTSEPKGVMITHANLADNLTLIVDGLSAVDDTVVVSWLPQYHDMGLIGSVLALLFCGGSGFYMSPVSFIKRPALWVELISRHRGTHMQAPNFAYSLTARKFLALDEQPQLDLSCVRHMINAAEPVDAQSIDRFYAVFEAHGLPRGVIFPTYGLAEHTVYVCSNGRSRLNVDRLLLETERKIRLVENKLELWSYGVEAAGSVGGKDDGVLTTNVVGCGRPADSKGLDLRIVDTETTNAMPEGNVGEIWIRSKSRAAGYWSQPAKTKEDFGGCVADEPEQAPGAEGLLGSDGSASGFLRTGDLGFLWDGELYICGRIKDLVIVRGRNHYPQDIERTAEAAIPGSLRGGCSAAFGTEVAQGGEALGVVAEVAQTTGVDFDALAMEIRRCVAAEHGASLETVRLLRPRTVPKTTSGKIARSMCKRAHLAGTLDRDTLFLWGDTSTTATARDATSMLVETEPASVVPSAGVEESKGRGVAMNPRKMTESDILNGIQFEVARILKADAISIPTDTPLSVLGLDSMEAMQLMALLEEKFAVKLPDDVMLEPDTTLASLAPVIRAGGAIPERATAIDCGMLAEEEAKDGPPKGYMADQAIEAKRLRRLAQCSQKARVDTGTFKPGSLSERAATMSVMDSLVARGFLYAVGGSEFATPVLVVLCLVLLPPVFTAVAVAVLVVLSIAAGRGLRRFPPTGRYSRVRACVMKHLGLKVVIEGKQDNGKPCIYVGIGLGITEQMLLSSIAPSAFDREVYQTAKTPGPFPLSPLLRGLQSLLGGGECCDMDGSGGPLAHGKSTCLRATSSKAAGLAPAVALAMRHGADVVPCVVLGSSCSGAGVGGDTGRFELAMGAVVAALALDRPGVLVACAKPVRVPCTLEPTQALVMEFAEAARAAVEKARKDYSVPFFGFE